MNTDTTTQYTFHEVAAMFPMMSREELAGLIADMRKHGQREPIVTYEGKVIDGRNRLRACEALGIEPKTREWDGEGSLVAYVLSLNLHRRHLDESQRAMVGARAKPLFALEAKERQGRRTDLRADLREGLDGGKASEKAAALVNVSPRTIDNAARIIERGVPDLAQLADAGALPVSTGAEAADLDESEQLAFVGAINDGAKPREALRFAKAKMVKSMSSSDTNEWYTPREYVDAARALMGAIDLDPASCEQANEWIQAATFHSVEDDGLSSVWRGRVWLNPPYGIEAGEGSNQARWSQRLIDEYENGNVTEAVLLVNAFTANRWFAALWEYPICFTNHRIKFINPTGDASQPTHGNAFVYLGKNLKGFVREFSKFGTVVRRVA